MRFQKTVDLLVGMHEAGVRRTVFLIGPPGIGKTSIAREAARQIGGKCWVNDLSSSLVEDLKGLPRPDGDVMRFIPDEKLKEACTDGAKGFFVLDDLAAADRSLQVAARQLSLDLTMHNHILSTDVSVVVTGNRRSDGAAAATLPSHFRNSVITLEVEPSLDDWSAWYRGTGLAPAVLAFLTYRPAHLETMPVAQEAGCLFDVASGAVGTGVASEFCAWLALRDKLVSPKDLLLNPKRALPDPGVLIGQPDQLTAMISGIVEHTLQADKITKASLERLVAAMAWTTRESREFAVFGIQQLAALGSTSVQNRFNRCLVGMRDTNKDVANLLAAFAASVR
jgi:MoxR-like ATPase